MKERERAERKQKEPGFLCWLRGSLIVLSVGSSVYVCVRVVCVVCIVP